MLKQFKQYQIDMAQMQPPSGGCVLKQYGKFRLMVMGAAAFGRLCVETLEYRSLFNSRATAAFGRLCVETIAPTLKRW